jgi:hypothetical protein
MLPHTAPLQFPYNNNAKSIAKWIAFAFLLHLDNGKIRKILLVRNTGCYGRLVGILRYRGE